MREVAAGEAIGYGAGFVTDHATRVGLLAFGYADSYPRAAEVKPATGMLGDRVVAADAGGRAIAAIAALKGCGRLGISKRHHSVDYSVLEEIDPSQQNGRPS